MHYTLADLLEGGILPSARLLTGEGDFSKVVIDSVSVQELPLDDFIQKNELVLSTAIGCDRDPQRYLQLIQRARQAHRAAMRSSRETTLGLCSKRTWSRRVSFLVSSAVCPR